MNTKHAEILKRLGIFLLVVISVVGGVLLTVRLALFLMPFLIAFTLSSMMEPLIRVLEETAHQEENICADNTPAPSGDNRNTGRAWDTQADRGDKGAYRVRSGIFLVTVQRDIRTCGKGSGIYRLDAR